jgi:diguanylate cyclase (GGDEF)-like protein
MENKNYGHIFFRASVHLIGVLVLFLSFASLGSLGFKDIALLTAFMAICIVMDMIKIVVGGGKGEIDLVDAVMAFIFMQFGIYVVVIFTFVSTCISNLIKLNSSNKSKDRSRILFNISMYVISAYAAGLIVNSIYSTIKVSDANSAMLIAPAYVCAFLLVNISMYVLDASLKQKIWYKFSREMVELLAMNGIVSSMIGATLCIISISSGVIGSVLVLGNLLVIHYCFYIYRKLKIRNDATKSLLKITGDIVKYGDFRDKCKHLVNNLKELIPYNMCAVYTFDVENDNVAFPIVYSAPSDLHIGDWRINLSGDSVTVRVIKEGKIYISSDITKDKNIKVTGGLLQAATAFVIVPIKIDQKVVGAIILAGGQDLGDFVSNGMEDILNILSNQMALAIENDGIYRDIKNKADLDPLTKLYNRRVFDRELDNLVESGTQFSMVIYDIDNFKQINDKHGHLAGDEVLKKICDIIKKSIRKTDIPCRYGGEELVVIFKDLKKDDAYIISERIREKIESTSTFWKGRDLFITVSGGVSAYPDDGKTKEDIIKSADEILYCECKNKGKNRVCAYKQMDVVI